MLLLAKAALGLGGALVVAGAYTFHEGVIKIDVDEYREGGEHVHVWVPAAVVPMVMHLAPQKELRHAARQAKEFLPAARAMAKELRKYPDAQLVEVLDGADHVQIRTHDRKLQIDVNEPKETVHLLVPLATLDDVLEQLDSSDPGA
jgi:hypothetical protein